MPKNYLTDSLGICASRLGVVNSTRSGWFDYRLSYDDGTTSTFSHDFSETSFKTLGVDGGWNGSLVTFDLYDIIDENRYYDNDLIDMYTHYEFEMTSGATPELYAINVMATYDHMVQSFGLTGNLSIGTDGIGYSMTPSLSTKFHRRTVSLPEPINYTPT